MKFYKKQLTVTYPLYFITASISRPVVSISFPRLTFAIVVL